MWIENHYANLTTQKISKKKKSIKTNKLSKICHHFALSFLFLNTVTSNQGMNAILETQRGISIFPYNFIRPL